MYMKKPQKDSQNTKKKMKGPPPSGLFKFLKNYKAQLFLLCFIVALSSGLNLVGPTLIATAIDDFSEGRFHFFNFLLLFSGLALAIFIITTGQGIVSAFVSEKVAFDLRQKIAKRISEQTYGFINTTNPATLLTNLTSDVDAVKTIVAQAIPILFSSILLILGSFIILFTINWRLAFVTLGVIALLMVVFRFVFGRSGELFQMAQKAIDRLNSVINESILASALIRVVNGQYEEIKKFDGAVKGAQEVSLKILAFFAGLVPIINFFANMAVLLLLYFGGIQVIGNTLTLGEFTAFYNYISLLILPVIMIGFISNLIVRATTSYARVAQVLDAPLEKSAGTQKKAFQQCIEFKDVSLIINEKQILKGLSFQVNFGEKTAIIGPTGAGKTLLLYLLSGLMKPTEGEILLDRKPLDEYDPDFLRTNIGVVFQDSLIFNGTIRENICFDHNVPEALLEKALQTAALEDYVKGLSNGLDHKVSERGASLSGGQKQRISLARALVLDPGLLLLDDFTARVDLKTEKLILKRLEDNFPDLTTLAVSQKISTVKDFDQLILIMEGELLAKGTHPELLEKSFEYRQIFSSQQTT